MNNLERIPMRLKCATLVLILLCFTYSLCQADIVSTNYSGFISAEFQSTPVTDTSNNGPAETLNVVDNGIGSVTETSLAWNWSGTTLTANSNLRAEKSDAGPGGGDHASISQFRFEFTIDTAANYLLEGFWQWEGNNPGGTDDLAGYSLVSGAGTVFSSNNTFSTIPPTQNFFHTGSLDPGTYTLIFDAELYETINSQRAATFDWRIDQFQINAVAVPEGPQFVLMVMMAISGISTYRQQKLG